MKSRALTNLAMRSTAHAARVLAVSLLAAISAWADESDRLYDFNDAYYARNGVNPAAIQGRRQPNPPLAVADNPVQPSQNRTRALLTLPAYDASGHPWYFTVLGGGNTTLFTNDASGKKARQIADQYLEYVFPRQGTDPVGLGALRQSVLLDMRNGYFSNNPLGLWTHVWVSFTPKAFSTKDGQKELADLAGKNGRDLDGTPIIRTVGDIDKLYSKGLVSKTLRPLTDGLHYSICPVVKDPTDGGIAPDQFLAFTAKADGSPLEPGFLANFLSLQQFGDWAD